MSMVRANTWTNIQNNCITSVSQEKSKSTVSKPNVMHSLVRQDDVSYY